jgi:Vps54-like protein
VRLFAARLMSNDPFGSLAVQADQTPARGSHGPHRGEAGTSNGRAQAGGADSQQLASAISLAMADSGSAEQVGAFSDVISDASRSGSPSLAQPLVVGGEQYHVVTSLVVLLQQVQASMAFGQAVPSLQFDMGHRIAQLLSLFNSRSHALLLGAAAIQTSGLRSITARHMAVCSQSLLLLEALLPSVRYCALQRLPATQIAALASLFEGVAEGLAQHRQQLHSKLVGIMRQRLSASLRQIHSVSEVWRTAPSADALGSADITPNGHAGNRRSAPLPVSPLFEGVIKQLTTLHGVLEPIMSPSQLSDVFVRVRRMYSDSLARCAQPSPPMANGDAAVLLLM